MEPRCKKCGSLDTYKEKRFMSGRVEVYKKKKNGELSKKYTIEGATGSGYGEYLVVWCCADCNNTRNPEDKNFKDYFDETPNTPRDGD